MIVERKMYTVLCDSCNKDANENSEISAWNDKDYAVDVTLDQEWKIIGKKHYCPNCWTYDENDEIVMIDLVDDENM